MDSSLTERERQVLALLAAGAARDTIPERLGISWHTYRTYLRLARAKIGARSITEAVVWFLQNGGRA